MPATMQILGWKAEGLRCPDHEINFSDENGKIYPISLVQMPNGTGKTTTLDLLRAALSGAGVTGRGWEREVIIKFKKKSASISYGTFEVSLIINDKPATIIMEFDFDNGKVYYKTTHGQGQREGFHPPPNLRRFMSDNFINFYVFDGELAQNLLNQEETDAQIVVENLFQMNILRAMSGKIHEYWEDKAQGATEERGLSRRQNRLIKLREHLAECLKTQSALKIRKAELVTELEKKREKHQQAIEKDGTLTENIQNSKAKFEQIKGEVSKTSVEILDYMRDPYALSETIATSMLSLKNSLDRVKLPESAAREFFEELAEEAECICGRSINSEVAKVILERAGRYLGTEDVSLLSSMKTSIKELIGEDAASGQQKLDLHMETLSSLMDDEREARNTRDALMLEAEQSDPAIRKAREEIENHEKEIENIDKELEKFESKDERLGDDRTFGIEILKKRIDDAEQKLAEITHTLTEKAKRDVLLDIIISAHEKSKIGITEDLCNKSNERISELMPDNSISIRGIEKSLLLEGQESGSVGENLSIAYAFLATLFHRSDQELPFVVDSPAGPIDLAVRPKIAELIPKLTDQFIAFTISSERAGFIEPLKRYSKNEIQFITLFRKNVKNMENMDFGESQKNEIADGITVFGEDFFCNFQIEDEENV